ncbi:hypothetical protein Tco_0622600 [Tanacetum coccineum]
MYVCCSKYLGCQGAACCTAKVHEGTDEVLEGTAQEYESTAGANLSTAEVYESTAHSLFKLSFQVWRDLIIPFSRTVLIATIRYNLKELRYCDLCLIIEE